MKHLQVQQIAKKREALAEIESAVSVWLDRWELGTDSFDNAVELRAHVRRAMTLTDDLVATIKEGR